MVCAYLPIEENRSCSCNPSVTPWIRSCGRTRVMCLQHSYDRLWWMDQLHRSSERSVYTTVWVWNIHCPHVCRWLAEYKKGCAVFCNSLNKPVENQRLLYFSHIPLLDKHKFVLQYCRIHDEKFYLNSCLSARTSLLNVLIAIFIKLLSQFSPTFWSVILAMQ